MEMKKGRHSVYSMQYHIILVVKYRRKVIDADILDLFRNTCKRVLQNNGGNLLELNGEPDHIHILAEIPPDKAVCNVIGAIKTQTSRMVHKHYQRRIQDKLWTNTFWSPSYFAATAGGVTLDVLERYVENQGKPKRQYHKSGKYKKKE